MSIFDLFDNGTGTGKAVVGFAPPRPAAIRREQDRRYKKFLIQEEEKRKWRANDAWVEYVSRQFYMDGHLYK